MRGKFVVLSAFIKNLGIPHISNLRILYGTLKRKKRNNTKKRID